MKRMRMSRDEELKSKLIELYPDRIVLNLSLNASLYHKVRNTGLDKGLEIEDYLKHLGFQSETIKKSTPYDEKLELVLNSLYEAFPDKKIPKSLFNDKGIYKKIYSNLYYAYGKITVIF